MDDKNKENDQDGNSQPDASGEAPASAEGHAENAAQDDDPIKKAFQNALMAQNQVTENELDTQRAQAEGHPVTQMSQMTTRDDGMQSPQQENPDNKGAQTSDHDDDGAGTTVSPVRPEQQGVAGEGASPVAASPLNNGLNKREATATAIDDQPSSNTDEESNGPVKKVQVRKKTSNKKKKKKKKRKQQPQQQMQPPPFYQFPFFGCLPQVQAQERQERAKTIKRDRASGTKEDVAGAAKAPTTQNQPQQAKKIEAVKVEQKEDDNGYLNLADLQAKEKEMYGEKIIGAPGDEYICLAEANDAAAGGAAAAAGAAGNKTNKPSDSAKSHVPGKPKADGSEFQDAVLTPKTPPLPGKPDVSPAKPPPKAATATRSATSDASMSRRKKAGAKPGAPVRPNQMPTPVASIGPNRKPRQATKEIPDKAVPGKPPTKRKPQTPSPLPPKTPIDKKGVVPCNDGKAKKKDEFQDAVLTPIQQRSVLPKDDEITFKALSSHILTHFQTDRRPSTVRYDDRMEQLHSWLLFCP